MNYAPVVVFGYNRADMLENLFKSLEKNENVNQMDLFIFLDIPDRRKKRQDIRLSARVIEYVNEYRTRSKFGKVEIEIAENHKGLAESIISGVTKVINQYGKVIVLEDDLEVSNDFLDYMQRGLVFYENDKQVWSLGGHCYPMKISRSYKKDIFLAPRVESWGWGTWKDRWKRTDWQVKSYPKFKRDIVGQMLFNLGGKDLSKMLRYQMADNEYNSWAIRWSYQQFRERKYTVYPVESRVIHCGDDNRSTHARYRSPQGLKDEYSRCEFCDLKPDVRMLWNFKRTNDSMA